MRIVYITLLIALAFISCEKEKSKPESEYFNKVLTEENKNVSFLVDKVATLHEINKTDALNVIGEYINTYDVLFEFNFEKKTVQIRRDVENENVARIEFINNCVSKYNLNRADVYKIYNEIYLEDLHDTIEQLPSLIEDLKVKE